jgi:hypothetical protein
MKKLFRVSVFLIVLLAGTAHAALLQVSNGILLGASGVDIAGDCMTSPLQTALARACTGHA